MLICQNGVYSAGAAVEISATKLLQRPFFGWVFVEGSNRVWASYSVAITVNRGPRLRVMLGRNSCRSLDSGKQGFEGAVAGQGETLR